MNEYSINPSEKAVVGRCCFVTVGSIASFRPLLTEVISKDFLACLSQHGYDALHVQCGPDYEWFKEEVSKLDKSDLYGINISSFDYTKKMMDYMIRCRGQDKVQPAGCVIAHAGAGTILEALRVDAPLIAVANPTLMDNHQLELAETVEEQRWAVHGKIGNLKSAVEQISRIVVQGMLDSLPPYAPPPFPVPAEERVRLFDWMVLTCYPEELARQQHRAALRKQEEDFHRQNSSAQKFPNDKKKEDISQIKYD
ncbi:glycosyltransferase family 28 C-terminal domain-containing protein [Cladorrhinum sp. PSN332]|nr:glycosyltransferase family 28 C-terminal domain-containing protein [Cladorrhinum sp. PSN332]